MNRNAIQEACLSPLVSERGEMTIYFEAFTAASFHNIHLRGRWALVLGRRQTSCHKHQLSNLKQNNMSKLVILEAKRFPK